MGRKRSAQRGSLCATLCLAACAWRFTGAASARSHEQDKKTSPWNLPFVSMLGARLRCSSGPVVPLSLSPCRPAVAVVCMIRLCFSAFPLFRGSCMCWKPCTVALAAGRDRLVPVKSEKLLWRPCHGRNHHSFVHTSSKDRIILRSCEQSQQLRDSWSMGPVI